jgi:NTE family protein
VASLKSYLEGLTNLRLDNRRENPRTDQGRKKVNLALQGGGAHGAFTWGVVDHLLADGRLEIAGISGASAGAINAVMIVDGLARGGPEEARKRLAAFWRAASAGGDLPPVRSPRRRFRAGSRRCRATSRPTTSTRSTSIRCAT